MGKPLLKDALAFEFDTNTGRKLELFGELVGWEDEIVTGLVEHRVLRRNGALHQNMGLPPRRHTFRCVITGANVQARYQFLADAITEDPLGSLIHPRFGHRAAACDGISAKETPGEQIDTIEYSIKFSEDQLQPTPVVSAPLAASAAASSAAQLVALTGSLPAVPRAAVQLAVSLQLLAAQLQDAVSDVALGAVAVPELAAKLSDLRRSISAIDAAVPDVRLYSLRAAAHLSYSQALSAYNAVLAGRPPIIEYPVRDPVSVAVLAARLYGGRYARAQAAEIKQFNRIADPLRLPAGTTLLLSDPVAVTRGL